MLGLIDWSTLSWPKDEDCPRPSNRIVLPRSLRNYMNCPQAARALSSLQKLENLEDEWNGYSASAPKTIAIQNANSLLTEALFAGIIPERIEPSAMGGVGVTFEAGSREVAVEFYNTGSAHALFANNETEEMSTERVPTDSDAYKVFLEKVRQHLYGHYRVQQSSGPAVS